LGGELSGRGERVALTQLAGSDRLDELLVQGVTEPLAVAQGDVQMNGHSSSKLDWSSSP
jgi:hypothetical protein